MNICSFDTLKNLFSNSRMIWCWKFSTWITSSL